MIWKRHSRWFSALLLVVLVTSLAAPVAAQSASVNNSTTSQNHWIGSLNDGQATVPSNNSTNGGNSGNSDGVLGGLGGGLVPSINPVEMAKEQLKAIAGIFLGVGKGIANTVRDSVAAVPAPGQPNKPST